MEHYDIVDDPIKEYFLDKLQGLEVKKRLLMIRKDQGLAKADQHKLSPLRQTNGTLNSARNPIDGKKNGSQTDINLQKDLIVGKYLKSENPVIGVLPPPKSSNTAGLLSHYQDRGKGSMDHKQRQLKKAKEMNYLGQLGEMVATEKTQERASSIAKEFHDQKNKNVPHSGIRGIRNDAYKIGIQFFLTQPVIGGGIGQLGQFPILCHDT